MPKFRKIPVVIEAIQFDGLPQSVKEICDTFDPYGSFIICCCDEAEHNGACIRYSHLSIETLEGAMVALPGSWIVRGTEGELYPVKASVFEAVYEAVTE